MRTTPEFTIKDLVIKPEENFANYEGENRVFIIFVTASPKMMKLNEGDKFLYESEIYCVMMRTPPDENEYRDFCYFLIQLSLMEYKNQFLTHFLFWFLSRKGSITTRF